MADPPYGATSNGAISLAACYRVVPEPLLVVSLPVTTMGTSVTVVPGPPVEQVVVVVTVVCEVPEPPEVPVMVGAVLGARG
jgi:hypothetical protein